MVKIEVTADTPLEMAVFLKEIGIDKIDGAHKCKCHCAEEAEHHETPETQSVPEHKEEKPNIGRRGFHRGGNPEIDDKFDRLCKEKGLTLKPEGKNTTKKICCKCRNPFLGYRTSRICPTCKNLTTRKLVDTPAVSAPEPQTPTTPKVFTCCIKCNTQFKVPQTDPMCTACRKLMDSIGEQLHREREEKNALERERRLQDELESRTKWRVCPACGTSFIPEKGSFYCNRCTEKALKCKKLK